jgi:hypothetical protein
MAAMKVRIRAGSGTLLDPQLPGARMLDLLCVDEMFSIRCRASGEILGRQRGQWLTAG